MGPNILTELGVSHPKAVVLCYDNIGATYLSVNLVFHAWTNILKWAIILLENVADKLLDIRIISSLDQVPNGFTKAQQSMGILQEFRTKSQLNKVVMRAM